MMYRIELHPHFKRAYRKRVLPHEKLRKQVETRISLFKQNPSYPTLRDHALKGDKEGVRSFSVSGDMRILYKRDTNTAYFLDIGTHSQVYE
jgi:addiction module RelE/StbE family toxin